MPPGAGPTPSVSEAVYWQTHIDTQTEGNIRVNPMKHDFHLDGVSIKHPVFFFSKSQSYSEVNVGTVLHSFVCT